MNAYGCVYLLTSPSGKHYVGQTVKNFDWYFNFTYVIGKGRKRVKLFNSINKHGICNGFYLILKKNLVTGEILLNRMVTQ